MSGPILSHPFRFGTDLAAATIDQDSSASTAQTLHAIVSTVRGEHKMAPTFGVDDPVFGRLRTEHISACLAQYYANDRVGITAVRTTVIDNTSQAVRISFEES